MCWKTDFSDIIDIVEEDMELLIYVAHILKIDLKHQLGPEDAEEYLNDKDVLETGKEMYMDFINGFESYNIHKANNEFATIHYYTENVYCINKNEFIKNKYDVILYDKLRG